MQKSVCFVDLIENRFQAPGFRRCCRVFSNTLRHMIWYCSGSSSTAACPCCGAPVFFRACGGIEKTARRLATSLPELISALNFYCSNGCGGCKLSVSLSWRSEKAGCVKCSRLLRAWLKVSRCCRRCAMTAKSHELRDRRRVFSEHRAELAQQGNVQVMH